MSSSLRSKVRGLRSTASGFTLIELIVVTIIIALGLAMAAGRFGWALPKYELRGVAREIGSMMKQAKSRAQATGKDVYMVYDIPEKRYWLLVAFAKEEEKQEALPGVPTPPPVYEYERTYERRLPKGVEITEIHVGGGESHTSGVVRVRIPPYGMADHHIVNLTGGDDRQMAVRLNGFTGYLSFFDEHQEPEEMKEDSGP